MTALAAALRVVVRCLEAELEMAGRLGVDREIAFWMLVGDLRRRGLFRRPRRRAADAWRTRA